MKTKLAFLFFIAIAIECFPQKLEQAWETKQSFQVPESVIYDEANDIIYVANINGDASEKDGNGFISRLSVSGKIKNLKWIDGLDAPKGMGIFGNKLYVADIDKLVEIDIKEGKILRKYEAEGAVFLNDVAVRINGDVFLSDTRTGNIYLLANGNLSVWLEDSRISTPNGLMVEQGKLFVGENSVYEVDIETKHIQVAVEEGGGIDGLERDHKGRIVFSHWAGRIFIVTDGTPAKLLDTSNKGINSADIDFAFKPGLLLVPTFSDNRIIAYKIVD